MWPLPIIVGDISRIMAISEQLNYHDDMVQSLKHDKLVWFYSYIKLIYVQYKSKSM